LIRFLVGFEAIDPSRHTYSAEGFAPGNGIRLCAARQRKPIGRLCSPADKSVDLFFGVDERLFQGITK